MFVKFFSVETPITLRKFLTSNFFYIFDIRNEFRYKITQKCSRKKKIIVQSQIDYK